jgi:hypothetical protein
VLLGLLAALVIGDPGRIDRQKTWPRIVTGAVIACLTLADLLAAARLVHDILTDNKLHASNATGLLATGRSAANAGRSRRGEHPGVRVSLAETLVDEAYQRPRFAESDVWHSLRMTRNACAGVLDGQRVGSPVRAARAVPPRAGQPGRRWPWRPWSVLLSCCPRGRRRLRQRRSRSSALPRSGWCA